MNVVDANVIKSGLLSSSSASNAVIVGMLNGTIPFAISAAMVLEYEDVLMREGDRSVLPIIGTDGVTKLIGAFCKLGRRTAIWYRFRPFLDDPKDDLYIECALAAGANTVVTFDKHFDKPAVGAFGLRKALPKDILKELGLARKPR